MLLKKILENQGIEVIECQREVKNTQSLISAYFKLAVKHRKLDYDLMLIPWRGIMTLPLAKIISKKPILYFPFLSIYDTLVNDRKVLKPNSIKAKFIHFADKFGCKLPNMIILGSEAEIDVFEDEYRVNRKKFRSLFLGADDSKFKPLPIKKPEKKFIVLYFGTYIPSHGLEYVIEAAKILANSEDIIFKFCGEGQTKISIENLAKSYNLKNTEFLGFVSDEELDENIKKSDVCLGAFGKSRKANNILFNKIYQIMASQKALITMDNNAMKEIPAINNQNCVLVDNNNPNELAEAIIDLKNNPQKLEKISKAGYKTYTENISMDVLGKKLLGYINELLSKNSV